MSYLQRFGFKTKLILLCLFLVTVSIAIGGVAFRGLNEVGQEYGRITTQVMPKLELANDLFVEFQRARIELRTLAIPGLSHDQEVEAIAAAAKAVASYEKSEQAYKDLGFVPGQKELFDEVHQRWLDFAAVDHHVLELHEKGTPDDLKQIAHVFLTDCPTAAAAYTAAMEKLLNFHKAVAKKRTDNASTMEAHTLQIVVAVGGIGTILALIVALVFTRSISRTMSGVADTLSRSAAQLNSASSQIAASSEELSGASSQQAASLEETASALEEISAMINKASDSASTTATRSSQSEKKAEQGQQAVGRMTGSIEDISRSNEAIMSQINHSHQQLAEIVNVIQDIGSKTKVINEIVFQTKLLSFNASVEAARAGEHGKGFAVVAEEVGNLAQMSGNAAKEISDMLSNSIPKVEQTVRETKEQVTRLISEAKLKVDAGVETAQECSTLLQEIVSEVGQVSNLAQDISSASREQSEGVKEINKAMAQLDVVTQQNASSSEEAASAAEQLSGQAHALNEAVNELVVLIEGAKSRSPRVSVSKNVNRPIEIKAKIEMKKKPQNSLKPAPELVQRVSGSDVIPSRDDEGFNV